MSMLSSVMATATSRVYLTAIGLLVLPLYLHRMGAEAYGLVALFFTLQVWFQLLDMGLTAAIAREAARFRGGSVPGPSLRHLLQMLERVFLAAIVLAGALLYLCSDLIASRWLKVELMEAAVARRAIEWMALSVMVRLYSELYRATISGFERLNWLAASNSVFGTLRFAAVLPFMEAVGANASNFFIFQFGVGLLELLWLRMKANGLVPPAPAQTRRWALQPLRGVLVFSLSMSLASVVWVVASQFDKLVLSGLLSLADYGVYGLAVAAAGGVLLATGSLADTLIPRITMLFAAQSKAEVVSVEPLYRRASQWTAIVAFGTSAALALHADRVLWAWTGDARVAASAAPVLAMYALGNAAMATAALPYYLQLAQGQLRLHLLGTGLMVGLLVPSVLWATHHHAAEGAAAAWLAVNLVYLLAWTPVAHRRFAPGLHLRWLFNDIAPAAIAATVVGMGSGWLPWPVGRVACGAQWLAITCAILLTSAASSSFARHDLRHARWSLAGSRRP